MTVNSTMASEATGSHTCTLPLEERSATKNGPQDLATMMTVDDDNQTNDGGSSNTAATTRPEQQQYQRRANKDLTAKERAAKKLMKKHLRQRTKLRKFELRIQQAKYRDDAVAVTSARQEWNDYMKKLEDDPDSLLFHCNDLSEIGNTTTSTASSASASASNGTLPGPGVATKSTAAIDLLQPIEDRESQRVKAGREWIIKIYKTLVTRIMPCGEGRGKKENIAARNAKNAKAKEFRLQSTIQARELLANMQKGTQTKSQFNNDFALLGYTRQKFIERAVLAFKLLDRLDPFNSICGNSGSPEPSESMGGYRDVDMWEQLLRTNQIMSIGCGPGCDLVGALGFFESHRGSSKDNQNRTDQSVTKTISDSSPSSRPSILLLDYVVEQWKRLVLDELTNLLSSEFTPEKIYMKQCDVRHPLLRKQPNTAQDEIEESLALHNGQAALSIKAFAQSKDGEINSRSNRLILVSYLLTETRHQWKEFFHDLLSLLVNQNSRDVVAMGQKSTPSPSSSTTLVLLTEPTAWQLHDFLNIFGEEFILSHTWLDSSREFPHLQGLEARMGPAAVLIALK